MNFSRLRRFFITTWLSFLVFLIEYHGGVGPASYSANDSNLPYQPARFGYVVSGSVSKYNEDLWLYEYKRWKNTQAVRVQVSSANAVSINPVVIVARLQKGVLSWSLPIISEESHPFYFASRTLCPNLESVVSPNQSMQYFHVHVASASPTPVNYTLIAFFVDNFEMRLNEPVHLVVDPAQPVYHVFNFDGSAHATVRIKAESHTQICAILSIQGTQCPVYDLARNVEFTGYYQTMTTKAAITIQRGMMKQFYVVVIVKSSDRECETGQRTTNPIAPRDNGVMIPAEYIAPRTKLLTITIEAVPSIEEHIPAIIFPIIFFGTFYVAAFFLILGIWCRQRRESGRSFLAILMPKKMSNEPAETEPEQLETPVREGLVPLASASRMQYGSFKEDTPSDVDLTQRPHTEPQTSLPENQMLLDGPPVEALERDYDMLHDLEHEKDIYRLRTAVTLADLAKKGRKYLKRKYRLYHWNLIIIAVFYTLPVVQLVITYQKVLNSSGDQDICYYNFFCAHPAGVLSAFNNVYSNIGYIMLGILFFLLVLRRDRLHRQAVAANDELEKHYGIPQHHEIFYAMAMALVMEGVLSACYHVCPNNSNFQFDTSFMYIITCLGMVKVYQLRHPDITASAHSVYASFAGIILISVIGVLFSSFAFWAVFCIIHIVVCLYLSSQLYYMGRVKFGLTMSTRMFVLTRCNFFTCPTYKDRMLLLLIANVINWAFAICGVVYQPKDFATYLLAILIVNGLLYVGFYVVMKLRNKEHILALPWVVISLSLFCWVVALVFFFRRITSWQQSPAHSREGNTKCRLMGFYDDHDIWHFLSACAMFFSFLALMTLDDDLKQVPRTRIPVF